MRNEGRRERGVFRRTRFYPRRPRLLSGFCIICTQRESKRERAVIFVAKLKNRILKQRIVLMDRLYSEKSKLELSK